MTSTFNVETTLSAWAAGIIADASLPSWLPSVTVAYDMQDVSASLPCFSLHHIPVSRDDRYQGRIVGAGQKGRAGVGLFEINAWATRQNANWQAQLKTMQDIIESAAISNTGVVIKDYDTDPFSPTTTGYRVLLQDFNILATAPDPNPDIERRRMHLTYRWTVRV